MVILIAMVMVMVCSSLLQLSETELPAGVLKNKYKISYITFRVASLYFVNTFVD